VGVGGADGPVGVGRSGGRVGVDSGFGGFGLDVGVGSGVGVGGMGVWVGDGGTGVAVGEGTGVGDTAVEVGDTGGFGVEVAVGEATMGVDVGCRDSSISFSSVTIRLTASVATASIVFKEFPIWRLSAANWRFSSVNCMFCNDNRSRRQNIALKRAKRRIKRLRASKVSFSRARLDNLLTDWRTSSISIFGTFLPNHGVVGIMVPCYIREAQ
jgi:hypothetical protein